MNAKISAQDNSNDLVKWIGVILLTVIGLVANYYYHEIAWALRLVGWIVLTSVILFLASQTYRGKEFLVFAKDSRMELRKVDWPVRQETIQFTIGVVVMVVIMALTLWLIDTTLLWIVKWFTG